jgi:general secretion pathway protein G
MLWGEGEGRFMSRLFQIFLVAVILVLIWGIVVPHGATSTQAKSVAAMTEIAEFSTALSMFKADCGRYPSTEEGLAAMIKRPQAVPAAQWPHPYLDVERIPPDPWDHPYIYKCPGLRKTNTFDVYSLGPNGKGGDEAIGNWTATNKP